MKRIMFSGLLILLCLIFVTACGSSGNSKSSECSGSSGCGGHTALTNNAASPTTNPVLLKQTVQVTLVEYKITSSITTFHVGIPYHFVVTNRGTIPHEFMIMPLMGDNISVASMDSASLVFIPIISPGQTGIIDYTFTRPETHLEMACHFTGRQASDSHYAQGMHLAIVVQ